MTADAIGVGCAPTQSPGPKPIRARIGSEWEGSGRRGGDGGAIILGADGSVSMPFNTEGMYRGWIGADGVPHVAIYGSDPLVLPSASR